MRRGQDISIEIAGLKIVHQNLPGKSVDAHSHDTHLLFLPLQGEISLNLNDTTLSCGPGKMIYLPPGTSHSFSSSSLLGERLICLANKKAWKEAGSKSCLPTVATVNQLTRELIFYLLLHPKTMHGKSLAYALLQTASESLDSLGETGLQSIVHLESHVTDRRVQAGLKYLKESVRKPSPMEQIAKKSGLSIRSFNRLFTEHLGLTPKQILIQYRMSVAQDLLCSGKLSVTETALEVGYSSLSQFISVFSRITGQLPSEVLRIGRKS